MIRPARFPDDLPAIEAVLDAVPGGEGLSEEPRWDLNHGADPRGLVAEGSAGIAGYAHLLQRRGSVVAEVAVPPADRDEALEPLVAAVAVRTDGPVRLWARDDATAAAAAEAGLTPTRVLLRLECPLPAGGSPAPAPPGVRIASFRPGIDEPAYLLVSNEAFADHPDSSGWDRAELAARMGRPWFDPGGLFLAWEAGRPVGLCWMKSHPGGIGEIYSIAVRPGSEGRGLGKALARAGLEHAAAAGDERGLLYADAANRRAVEIYRGLGFTETGRSREFAG